MEEIKMLKNIALIFLFLVVLKKLLLFKITPKKSKELYDGVFAHRGFHMWYPENTIEAYLESIKSNFLGIELDIRYLKKDGNIICFHDRYTDRLLRIPGKISMFKLEELKRFAVQDSNSKIPSLNEALDAINGRCLLLIEVKGNITKDYLAKLNEILDSYAYPETIYFHTKNMRTYKKLKNVYGSKVFYVLNPFRKRFNFIKGSDYKVYKAK